MVNSNVIIPISKYIKYGISFIVPILLIFLWMVLVRFQIQEYYNIEVFVYQDHYLGVIKDSEYIYNIGDTIRVSINHKDSVLFVITAIRDDSTIENSYEISIVDNKSDFCIRENNTCKGLIVGEYFSLWESIKKSVLK